MLCSYTNCTKSFLSIKGLIVHLKSHNINIEPEMLNFNAIEGILISNYIIYPLIIIITNLLFFMYSVIQLKVFVYTFDVSVDMYVLLLLHFSDTTGKYRFS